MRATAAGMYEIKKPLVVEEAELQDRARTKYSCVGGERRVPQRSH